MKIKRLCVRARNAKDVDGYAIHVGDRINIIEGYGTSEMNYIVTRVDGNTVYFKSLKYGNTGSTDGRNCIVFPEGLS